MSGVDRYTGRPITDGWVHVTQSLEVIFTTRFGERVMREWFGSDVPALLGELGNPTTFVRYYAAIARGISVKEINGIAREPRFRITAFEVPDVTRTGEARVDIEGIYMPLALYGDFRAEGTRSVKLRPDGLRGVVAV